MVVVLNGNINNDLYVDQKDQKISQKTVIYNSEGKQFQLSIFDNAYAYKEFVVSMGKDLMYIMSNIQVNFSDYHIRVYVIDLQNTSTIFIKDQFTYFKYDTSFLFTFTIQAFADNSAVGYFYNINKHYQPMLVQLKYSTQGKEEFKLPKEINSPLNGLQRYYQYWTWHSYLHEDGEHATFLANDLQNNYMIYTFNKNGQKICSSVNYIYGFINDWYHYGIVGDQGWIYLEDKNSLEGYFGIFDAKKLKLYEIGTYKYKDIYVSEGEGEGEDIYEGECIYEGEQKEEGEEGEGEQQGKI
ncbi:hypothetical protein PPERSA_03387 [Pseudocohnilembus persalinus]|uniref:Uncharacterized protein n=1 Tax=Pseudocohnilembus persalinus TaxID=266149 RepID=A0A0V0QMI6_PSEPJ|nr:hypothetical protein PPERSA_03387 [Pseudocohnilembus persalinus]|eukprot:KRX03272.1 hypothetical protein PPERSA_03387 [Pseudocohnilembus persalinus]